MKKAVMIHMEEEVLKYVDGFADKNGISRSGAISVIVSQYRQSMDGVDAIKQLMVAYQAEQEKKQLPEQERE